MTVELEKIKSTNRVLIIALIIAAFFLGSLTNKVATLEKEGSGKNSDTLPAPLQEAQGTKAGPAIASDKLKPLSVSDHVKGNAKAKITLIQYSDYECPFCKNFESTIKEILNKFPNEVKLALRHYPLPFHQNAQKEAEASECVAELGGNDAFWKFTDMIYERTTSTSDGTGIALDKLGPMAGELGIDTASFQNCLDSGKHEKLVKDSVSDAQTAGVGGTPSTFINGKLIVGACPLSTFEGAIKTELEGKPWGVENCQIN